MSALIEKEGVNKEATNVNGQTPLHLACLNAHADIVGILLKAGAERYARNVEGDCPTHLTVKVCMPIGKSLATDIDMDVFSGWLH